jgi:hypothetical protein
MDWISYLVIFLFVAVYILNQLAKSQQQKPPRPQRDEDEAPRRRPVTQLEKFLEDMQRRKEGEDVRTAAPIYEAVEVPPKPAAPRSLEQRRKSAAPAGKKPPRRAEARVVIEPSRQLAMPSLAPAAVPENQTLPPPPDAPQAIHRPEALPAKAPQSPAVKMVHALLKNRQALGAAFLLREILDRPRCRRPR